MRRKFSMFIKGNRLSEKQHIKVSVQRAVQRHLCCPEIVKPCRYRSWLPFPLLPTSGCRRLPVGLRSVGRGPRVREAGQRLRLGVVEFIPVRLAASRRLLDEATRQGRPGPGVAYLRSRASRRVASVPFPPRLASCPAPGQGEGAPTAPNQFPGSNERAQQDATA